MTESILTVITVCFNAQEYISATLESVLSQKLINFSYLIVDGGSSDKTMEIIDNYIPKFIKADIKITIISEKDNGIYDAMNKGAMLADGEWLCYMNAGDVFFSNEILSNLHPALCNTTCNVLYGDVVLDYGDWEKIIYAKPLEVFNYKMAFCHQSAIIRRSAQITYPYDISLKIAADYKFFYTLWKLDSLQFCYVGFVISKFEAIDGLANNNPCRCLMEYDLVNKRSKSRLGKLLLNIRLLKAAIKHHLTIILPTDILKYVREKTNNSNQCSL